MTPEQKARVSIDALLTQQNQRRRASYRVAEDSPQLARLAGLSTEILDLLPLAEPARKNKKLPVAQLKDIVQQLCQGRWLATSELAALVDRDAEKLQSRFLTAMVKEGVLELRFPEVRNRPDQAYRAVPKNEVIK
jgi:ATP-dependent DNA helicase RecG